MQLLTTKELAEFLNVTVQTIWRYRVDGMPYIKLGRVCRYELDEVMKWLKDKQGR